MTRWLQAARQATADQMQKTEPTPPAKVLILAGGNTVEWGVSSDLSVLSERGSSDPAQSDGLDRDAGAYLDWLRLHGPASYGAMAAELGWGATRAWQAEAKLRALGLVIYREGKAEPTRTDAR